MMIAKRQRDNLMQTKYNFSAGPAAIPTSVLQQVQNDILDWKGTGLSIMGFSHRSSDFMQLAEESEMILRELMEVPDNYHVLFCHGGGSGQFSAVPLNLVDKSQTADYVVSGHWSKYAAIEASKFCKVNTINIVQSNNQKKSLLAPADWPLSEDAQYVFFCPNETVDGLEINELPITDKPIIADMSSFILSRPIDVSKYGVIYAGAQKNIGPAGLTLVIVRDDLLGKVNREIPTIFDYEVLAENYSMPNTPPTYPWYVANEVFKWLKEIGGVSAIYKINIEKAALLYEVIDNSSLYINHIDPAARSIMNVPFYLKSEALTEKFVSLAHTAGLTSLKGHSSVGGIRASIYNAMPIEGVKALVHFMKQFEDKFYIN